MSPPTHGGPDALGVPVHDLSTNANACGPYAPAVQALRVADARHYPDPAYTALTVQLAAWHGVAPARIVLAASGSEFIQR
ncbi:MAG: aminotransferase, partial [Ottowia sp.]|nr:aminotransferase [Ottowia sp.]